MNIKIFEKKDQDRDLPAADLEEQIDTLVTQGCLLKMRKLTFSANTPNSANAPTKNQENKFDDIDHNTNDETSENENVSISTEESISDSPKGSFSVSAEKIDTLHNFFLKEISDIKGENQEYL